MAADRARSLSRDEALEQSALRLRDDGERRHENAERSLPGLLVVGADEILLPDVLGDEALRLSATLPHHGRQCAARLSPLIIPRLAPSLPPAAPLPGGTTDR